MGMMVSLRASSLWKKRLFFTIILENSRGPYSPAKTGWMNTGHSLAHTLRISGIDLAAGWPRESHTAAVKRPHSHSVSSSFAAGVTSGD